MQVCADVHEKTPVATVGYENRRVSSEAVGETVLHAHGGAFQTSLLILRGEIKREVLDEEQAVIPQCHAVEGAAFGKHRHDTANSLQNPLTPE